MISRESESSVINLQNYGKPVQTLDFVGQLVTIVFNSGDVSKTDPFYIEDDEMLKHFQNYLSKQTEERT